MSDKEKKPNKKGMTVTESLEIIRGLMADKGVDDLMQEIDVPDTVSNVYRIAVDTLRNEHKLDEDSVELLLICFKMIYMSGIAIERKRVMADKKEEPKKVIKLDGLAGLALDDLIEQVEDLVKKQQNPTKRDLKPRRGNKNDDDKGNKLTRFLRRK